MVFVACFFFELLLLFFFSKQLTILLSRFLFHLTKSKAGMIYLMAFLFLPGTVIHELSHFLMAQLLFVQTGEIELWPKVEGASIKLGSVQVARTDPFRRFFIGAAPFLFGTSMLLAVLFYAVKNNWFGNTIFLVFILYTLFEVGNTMFSSRKDMEGVLELFAVLIFFMLVFYFIGVRLPAVNLAFFFANPLVLTIFQKGSLFLLMPLGIDIGIIGVLTLLRRK